VIIDIAEADLTELRAQAHPHCIVCSRSNGAGLGLEYMISKPGEVQARFDCGNTYQGYSGMLHGGIVTSLIDGAMTNCLFARGVAAVTASLNVQFRHPVVIGLSATVRAWIERSSPPRHVIRGELVQGEQITTTAVGRFLEQDHLMTAQP